VQNRALLASGRLPTGRGESRWTHLVMASNDAVRAYVVQRADGADRNEPGPGVVRIFELDATTRTLQNTGNIPFWGRTAIVVGAPDGRALVRSFWSQGTVPPIDAPPAVRLVDGRTGATVIAATPSAAGARVGGARLLSDGRLTVVENRNSSYYLRVFSAMGTFEKEVALGNAASVRIEGQAAKDIIIISSVGEENAFGASFVKPWTMRTVDLTRGAVLHERPQLRAAGGAWGGIAAGSITPIVPCVDADRRLIRWNALTNAVEPIVWKKG
jgi:hypothetical protein